MPITRTTFAVAIIAVLLFACHAKKRNPTPPAATLANDTAQYFTTLPDENFTIEKYSNLYINAVTQKFIVAKHKTAVVKAKKGLRVTVNPAVLLKEDGTAVDGLIQISIVELTGGNELFAANATTVCNGRLLASGGSYFIGMECNGQKLKIKKGSNLNVEFPKLQNEEMELFYGNRDADSNMNWIRAGQLLTETSVVEDEILFTDSSSNADIAPAFMFVNGNEPRIYRTTEEKVYYYDKMVTIKQLVDTVNRHTAKIYLDTVYIWPKVVGALPPGARIDSNFLYNNYGPPKQFIIKLYRNKAIEKAKEEKQQQQRRQALVNWKPKTLAGQLQKYYSTSQITTLGWINCDRFYGPSNNEIELELPGAFVKSTVHYFLIYKSFFGLINGKIKADSLTKKLYNLPANESVKLVAFIKKDGKLYQCIKDFTVSNKLLLQTKFEEIAYSEMKKMFGGNIKI